ncbi:ATP-dependent DNA helicase RecG [Collinsella sp. zg1085]|uniref:ATP-dependent DNA helicase RecG n=1 Tax=Collinsella sp. zg1085 TaxID=2844380 RepID=UPI001C0A9D5E|nr:ATP-dependent DNA helicase RecG [Collinsella sp. zg1085]QWT17128.1 ATP-dependent DNA helicase RecG [Collinsella sp. zg1085]
MQTACSLTPASERIQSARVPGQAIERLRFVNESRSLAFSRLGIHTVMDLLLHIPRRYLDFTHAYCIEDAPLGQLCSIVATIDRIQEKRPRPKMHITEVFLVDETGVLQCAFFKQPWLAKQLKVGDRLAVMGKLEFAFGFKQMSAPHMERLDAEAQTGSILPVHPATEGISPAWMRRIMAGALECLSGCPDPIPAKLRARLHIPSRSRALRAIHFPVHQGDAHRARRRLAYDEVLFLQLALRLRNDVNLLQVRATGHVMGTHVQNLKAALPFSFSEEQQIAVAEICADMQNPAHVMNRLLLGDVGTGKTAVACMALALVADTGTQAAVMAPTGVLAQQYATSIGTLLDKVGITWALLTGATPLPERRDIIERAQQGKITVLMGTHAILQDDVQFARLSLVVIDEQHRFGVNQRAQLRQKGIGADLLVMTATPIPRTLALSVYGDLDTSIIKHRPMPGAGVKTQVLTDENRDIAYGALRDTIEAGQQAYVICPLVSPKDTQDDLDDVPFVERDDRGAPTRATYLKAVTTEVDHIRQVFPHARVAMLHGRMNEAEKQQVLFDMQAHKFDILVSTTVVEVGVDIPNATLMIIEHGERFGLATLHQLRGRVGRGSISGTCYVISSAGKQRARRSPALDRLKALEASADGFELAERDLRLRHEGEILGLRQSGGVTLRFIDLGSDADIIEAAHQDAQDLLAVSPTLECRETLPLRHELVDRFGSVFVEASGA